MSEALDITILTDPESWLVDFLPTLVSALESAGHVVAVASHPVDLGTGDICFYLSVGRIISAEIRARFTHNLVVHESDLPKGKGWSPMTWQILEGASQVVVTLFEAEDRLDSGAIYGQKVLSFSGTELVDEWRKLQAEVTFALCREFVDGYPSILQTACAQVGEESFYPRRKPGDSRLDPEKSIAEQFNLLRVVDNSRYPAFFDYRGERYVLMISKADHNDE